MNSLFCRHNRFTADCPICSKGTVLDPARAGPRPRGSSAGPAPTGRPGGAAASAARVTGPYASAGPYEDDEGTRYDVRLERVPGGVRLAEWSAGEIRRRAPVLGAAGLVRLMEDVREREILPHQAGELLVAALHTEPAGEAAPYGASRGRAGLMQEELRVERIDDDRLRIGRWILRPGAGWELQQAPPMLPAARFADALRSAALAGVLAR